MNKINELIRKLCPDGVEYLQVGSFCEVMRGRVMSRDYIRENAGDYPVYSSQAMGDGIMGYINTYDFDGEYITWTTDGVNAGAVFYHDGKFSTTNVCGIIRVKTRLLPKFLYYSLKVRARLYVNRSKGNHKLMSSTLSVIEVPIPPLEVQRAIISQLDCFEAYQAHLDQELSLRQKQYQYYCHRLLQFDTSVKRVPLRDLTTLRLGKEHEKTITSDGPITVINAKYITSDTTIRKYCPTQLCPLHKDELAIVMSDLSVGNALARCWLVDEDNRYTLNQRIGALTINNTKQLFPRYFYYAVNRTPQLLKYNAGCNQINLRVEEVMNVEIPLPDLAKQKKIAAILDHFRILVSKVGQNLPSEMSLRQTQEEYYRWKMIDFPRKPAS